MEAASKIRLENAKVGSQWKTLPEAEKAKTPAPLTAKEMQFLFTEASPRHYTSEMTAAKLSYMSVGNDARTKTEALLRGEISPSPEAAQLIDSLESRLGRRQLKDSVSATKHFLQSLKTPNAELRYKNEFDHCEIYRKLPPAERDFVYQRAVLQKESLEKSLIERALNLQMPEPATAHKSPAMDFNALREDLKARFVEFVTTNPKFDDHELSEGVTLILETSLATKGLAGRVDHESVKALSHELSDGIGKAPSRLSTNHSQTRVPIPERGFENTTSRQIRAHDIYTR